MFSALAEAEEEDAMQVEEAAEVIQIAQRLQSAKAPITASLLGQEEQADLLRTKPDLMAELLPHLEHPLLVAMAEEATKSHGETEEMAALAVAVAVQTQELVELMVGTAEQDLALHLTAQAGKGRAQAQESFMPLTKMHLQPCIPPEVKAFPALQDRQTQVTAVEELLIKVQQCMQEAPAS